MIRIQIYSNCMQSSINRASKHVALLEIRIEFLCVNRFVVVNQGIVFFFVRGVVVVIPSSLVCEEIGKVLVGQNAVRTVIDTLAGIPFELRFFSMPLSAKDRIPGREIRNSSCN